MSIGHFNPNVSFDPVPVNDSFIDIICSYNGSGGCLLRAASDAPLQELQIEGEWESLNYSITDVNGKEVLKGRYEKGDVIKFPNYFNSGVYFMTLTSHENQRTIKLIKN